MLNQQQGQKVKQRFIQTQFYPHLGNKMGVTFHCLWMRSFCHCSPQVFSVAAECYCRVQQSATSETRCAFALTFWKNVKWNGAFLCAEGTMHISTGIPKQLQPQILAQFPKCWNSPPPLSAHNSLLTTYVLFFQNKSSKFQGWEGRKSCSFAFRAPVLGISSLATGLPYPHHLGPQGSRSHQ